jgi:hypothetical protein
MMQLDRLIELLTNAVMDDPDLADLPVAIGVLAPESEDVPITILTLENVQVLNIHAWDANPDDPFEPPGEPIIAFLATNRPPAFIPDCSPWLDQDPKHETS